MNEELLTLIGGYSLISPHLSEKIPLSMANEKRAKDIEGCPDGKCTLKQFGLFDTASPNYTTYYGDVTAEDLNPKDEELIYPVFRLLSSVTVNKNSYSPTFFPKDVLKNSMSMLLGQTVYVDHEMATGNALGVVVEVEWQEAYKTPDGTKVPAGINGKMKIDGKSNPRLARLINMEPPAIHSNSVTIQFSWEQSHKNMEPREFYEKMGTYDKDGNLIQKVATEVKMYYETSLVPHGADPFAKLIKSDGKINNPRFSGKRDGQFSMFSYKSMSSISTTILDNFNQNNNDKTENSMNKKLLELLKAKFGFKPEDLENESFDFESIIDSYIEGKTNSLQEVVDKYNAIPEKLREVTLTEEGFLSEEATKILVKDFEVVSANAKIGESHINSLREETIKNYNLLNKDNASEEVVNTLKSAGLEALEGFNNEYKTALEEKFPMKCNDCNSENVSRMSANHTEDGNGGEENQAAESFEELEKRLRDKRRKPSFEDID